MTITRVRAFYPADPVGVVPGGIDTFIRGIVKWAPEDIEFSLVGMTTNPLERQVGKWTRCRTGRRDFDFFPVVQVANAGQRTKIPLSLRYTAATTAHLRAVRGNFDVFEFHRIEPGLLFQGDHRPKCAFFHQDMAVIRDKQTDILWRHFPWAYRAVESRIVKGLSSIWCVRQTGVESLVARYPEQAGNIRFVPTWVDEEVFSPLTQQGRAQQRSRLAEELRIDAAAQWIVSVGRLDKQKDPDLLISAFGRVVATGRNVVLLLIGDGVLRDRLEQRVTDERLGDRVRFLGLRDAGYIARIDAASDVFALSSSYEGMPMAVLEALGSGLPVASTDVGEVRSVVHPGRNGAIAEGRSVEAFAACMDDVLNNATCWSGEPAVGAVTAFRPSQVLQPVYQRYRELGALNRVDGLQKRRSPV